MLIGAVLLLNYLSIHSRMFGARTEAYGLDYTGEKKEYRQGTLDALANDTEAHKKDKQQTLEMLHKWRRKNISWNGEKEQKPKLVLLNASGGGSRSALWTFSCLQYADSALNGELMKHIPLITGSSGGMIGASYFRELYLKKMHNSIEVPSPYSDRALANISKDLLNPVALSIATNDLFIRYQEFNYGKFQYTKDRGYAFERGLIQNTEGVLDKRLGQYTLPVQKAQVPMMIFSPTVVQDGRRFLISSLPVSYMMDKRLTDIPHAEPLAENIDFTRFFREQGARNIRLTSILRMNASFPYILPFTTMPTKPSIELMDSGLRDNYGLLTSLQFMHKFRDWIRTNTSGVVILKLRDKQKTFDKIRKSSHSMLERLVTPMGSLYGNLFNMQDLDQDQLLQHAATGFDAPLDVVTFQLRHDKEDRISLSLHLTALEKRRIKSAVRTDENQAALKRLKKLLGEEKASASH